MADEPVSIFESDIYVQKTSRFYLTLIVLFFIYIIFSSSVIIRENWRSLKAMDKQAWLGFLILIAVPSFALFLFIRKKKIGWSLCITYYMFIALTFLSIPIQEYVKTKMIDYSVLFNWHVMLFLLLGITSTILLLLPDIRAWFKITAAWLRVTLVISIFLSCTIVALMTIYD